MEEYLRVVAVVPVPETNAWKIPPICLKAVLRSLLAALFDAPKDPTIPDSVHAVLWTDIPLQPLSGIGGSGPSPFSGQDVEHYRKHGKLRAAPLRPPDRPLAVLAELEASPEWRRRGEEEWSDYRITVMNQLLRLVEAVYPLPSDVHGQKIRSGPDLEERWLRMVAEVEALGLRWDERRNTYIAGAGEGRRGSPRARGAEGSAQ